MARLSYLCRESPEAAKTAVYRLFCAVALTFTELARCPQRHPASWLWAGTRPPSALTAPGDFRAGVSVWPEGRAQLLCQGHAHLPYIQKAGARLPWSPWCFGTSAPAKSSVYGSSAPCVPGAFVSTRKLPFISQHFAKCSPCLPAADIVSPFHK